MVHRRQGYRFDDDWNEAELQKRKENWRKVKTVPVNVDLKAEHRVLNLNQVRKYLENAERIALLDCDCRTRRNNCDAPLDVCIFMDNQAEMALTDEEMRLFNPKEVSVSEALDALERSHEAGLVHMALSIQQEETNTICSCCSCCCVILSAVLRFGLAPHLLTSDVVSVMNTSDCTDCGVCADRCQFGAREMVNGSLVFNSDLCFGCGLCSSTCPTSAITLVDK